MLCLVLSLVSVLILPTDANLCYEDVDLDNVKEYNYTLPYPPHHDYWNKGRIHWNIPDNEKPLKYNMNLGFHVFGRFSGKTSVIKAGYYGEEDKLIYSVEVDCATKIWKTYIPADAQDEIRIRRFSYVSRNSQDRILYQWGFFKKDCVDGEDFDLIFKVKQAHQFTLTFNAEPMQQGLQETYMRRRVFWGFVWVQKRLRTLNVPSPDPSPRGGAAKAVQFKVEISGAAVITRFAFGRCVPWPSNMTCNEAHDWLYERSKQENAQNHFGLHHQEFNVECLPSAPTLFRVLQFVHPDEFSRPQSTWVCCVDMKTGQIWENNRKKNCRDFIQWHWIQESPLFCEKALDVDLILEEMVKYQAEQNEVEAKNLSYQARKSLSRGAYLMLLDEATQLSKK